jgi:hypothetical protein
MVDGVGLDGRVLPDRGPRRGSAYLSKLFPVYAALMDWGNRWTGLPAAPVDILHKPCGERVVARVVCSGCGQDLDAHDTEPVVGRGLVMHRENRK